MKRFLLLILFFVFPLQESWANPFSSKLAEDPPKKIVEKKPPKKKAPKEKIEKAKKKVEPAKKKVEPPKKKLVRPNYHGYMMFDGKRSAVFHLKEEQHLIQEGEFLEKMLLIKIARDHVIFRVDEKIIQISSIDPKVIKGTGKK